MEDNQQWMPRIDRIACIGCGDCIAICPTNALGQIGGKASLTAPERCTYCIACEDICPVNAIELPFLIVLTKPSNGVHDEEGTQP